MPRVVIVGGGISGLALAYRLQQRAPAAEITVLETAGRPGGTIWTERREGFQVETGPNGFLDNKPFTARLCRDIGLGDQLVAASDAAAHNRYLFLDGKLRRLPGGLKDLLTSDLLTWRGKFALLAEPLRRRRRDGRDESIAAFARRRAGAEAARTFADALVTGIYAGDPELLSVRATFPRLAGFEEQYGSVVKGFARAARLKREEARSRGEPAPGRTTMWSFRHGLRVLVENLAGRLSRAPVLGTAVRRVEPADGQKPSGWKVVADGQSTWTGDAVALACPAYQQAAMVADLDRELADQVGGIPYNRVTVLALGYRRSDVPGSLDGFGYIAPQNTRRDLLGVQWCSSTFPDRAPAGMVLLRAMCGGWHRPEVAAWDEVRLLEAVRGELRLAMGISAPPIFHSIIRWDRAIPQYHLGHLHRVAWIEERLARHPGLFLTGNAYRGVALNDCTEQAEVQAQRIVQYLEGGAKLVS